MHEGHRQRLKENFMKNGLDDFQPHNILELLLFYTIPRSDTNETAHLLMEEFGSLSAVFEASPEDLVKVKGVGEHSASLIHLIPEITRAYLKDKQKEGKVLDTPEKAAGYLLPYFVGKTKENVVIICLDNKCKVKNCVAIAEGTVNAGEINKRKIAEIAIRNNASSVILAHNHPNGIAAPSKQDVEMTLAFSSFLKSIDVKLSDHIIVAADDWCSMASSAKFAPVFG